MGFGFVGVYGSGLGRFRVLGVVRLMLFGFLSKESTPKLCFTGVSGLGLWVWGVGLRVHSTLNTRILIIRTPK